ncbi:MAG: DUF3987 domain-containing protein [Deltaproteobacteria bacterium]|nr:DUF3987 domain-containing protein [Deltaproteobacteria bacterium]
MDRYEASHGQDGFLERFQIAVYPDPIRQWSLIERKPDKEAFVRVLDLFEFLDAMEINENSPKVTTFSEAAQPIANEWRRRLELRLLSSEVGNVKKSYLSKYRSLMPSLSLIFEVMERHAIHEISLKNTTLAICWTEILESHMDKILCVSTAPESGAKLLLEKIKSGEIYEKQSVREIYRKAWRGLREPERTTQALSVLQRHGYIRQVKHGTGGQATELIYINPSLGGAP